MSRPAVCGHPRTDIETLSATIEYICSNGGSCAIAEGASGCLMENLKHVGLADVISKYDVDVIDLDNEEAELLNINGEDHYLPGCLKEYGVRIGIPATSKRPGMIFSNNIKLFVGAVPKRMYQIDNKIVDWRPRVHIDLQNSVANIFSAIQKYAPFCFFINGGLATDEYKGDFRIDELLIGNDGIELDLYMLKKYYSYLEIPEYIIKLQPTGL
jgi:hypothetical protein